MDLLQQLVDAFNARDAAALASLMHEQATATLVGSTVEPEVGPAAMCRGSFPHMLAGPPLHARIMDDGGARLIVCTNRDNATMDLVIEVAVDDDRIAALRYRTLWHDRDYVTGLAARVGVAMPSAPS